MKLKKLLATILTTLAICTMTINTAIPPLITEAHSGRTDSRGGHKDNKNKSGLGYYHYHCGGNPPHLHKDGVCPYAKASNPNSSPSNIKDSTSGTNNSNTTDNNTTPQSLSTVYNNVAFNAQYYASNYPDVYMIYGNNAKALYEHFISSGITDRRQTHLPNLDYFLCIQKY